MRTTRFVVVALSIAVLALPALAQNPTGTITGQVMYQGTPLPGVTVTTNSPALQGSKTTVTGGGGNYIFRFLPPGEYVVRFMLDGFQTLEQSVKVSVAQTTNVDATMTQAAITEEITVTGSYETISSESQAATTYEQELINQLPVGRDLETSVLLTPGTSGTGVNGISVAGAQSYENLYLINGVVVNENLRGQAFDLYIEDAIEETTTSVSGVSAEYGRFSGGVVNAITKSGGNEFNGSVRVNLTNDDWQEPTPLTTSQLDDINQVYEATLGGFILRDRLWFFLAGRDFEEFGSAQTFFNEPYEAGREQTRYEGKLTFSPHVSHRLLASYIEIDTTDFNNDFYDPLTTATLVAERTLPQDLLALNYTGVITENFFLEGQYSERNMSFVGSGGDADPGDRINGTHILFYPSYSEAGSPLFCAQCGDEERNNENFLAKASYFLSSEGWGSHDIVAGYDTFSDIRLSNNYQSPSNFNIWGYTPPSEEWLGDDGNLYPVFTAGEDIDYWPIFTLSAGTDFQTDSLYLNDTWRYNDRWSFNLGVRYDENDGVDGAGNVVAEDSRFSPRLGASWDIQGDGEWIAHASLGRYVMAIANSVGDTGGGGTPSYFGYTYGGPDINLDADGNYIQQYTTEEALGQLFAWFDSVGGLSNTDLWYANPSIRGVNTIVQDLESPYADEYTIGLTKRLGNRGLVRADLVHRTYEDFYVTQRDTTTGTVFANVELVEGVPVEQEFDLGLVGNDPGGMLEREYDGLHTNLQYRFRDDLSAGLVYTLSRTEGNFVGESTGSGPVTSGYMAYPEYAPLEFTNPSGYLENDQRHQARAFVVWDALSTANHTLSVSVLQSFLTGGYYGAQARVLVGPNPYGLPVQVENTAGYLAPPSYVTGYVTDRDEFQLDDITHTDLSLNYSFFLGAFGRDLEFFVQPEVINVFDEDAVVDVNTDLLYHTPFGLISNFGYWNPNTTAAVEGEHFEYGPDFGQPEVEGDFQTPRTFRVSLGLRF